MKIYITGLPSGYEVEHLVRLFYPDVYKRQGEGLGIAAHAVALIEKL